MSPLSEQLRLLPERFSQHVLLVAVALAAGIVITAPLTYVALRWRPLRFAALGVAGIVQTIPGLALLALMVPTLDAARRVVGPGLPAFGFLPAVLALTLYAILPVLRNAVTGLEGVDPAVLDAATGLGLSPRQRLWQVQLPLASAVIVAGLRTSAVWTVGAATLSTPVGQTSLGNYIFSGLQTRNWTAVLVGCVAAAGLAVALDVALGQLEDGARRRRRAPLWRGIAVLLSVALLALGATPGHASEGRGAWRIGCKNFTEQYLLCQVLADALRAKGLAAEQVEGLGSTVLFDALAQGDIDIAVDYSGTLWTNQLRRSDRVALDGLSKWLDANHGIRVLGPLGFENAYALAMPRLRARSLDITSLEALAAPIRAMKLGSDYEFFSRPEWQQVSAAYGLEPKQEITFDPSLMYEAVTKGEVDVITAFTTDGRINAFDLLVLDDPRHAFPRYDALLMLGRKAQADPDVVAALTPWVGAIDLDVMRRANELVDVEAQNRTEAARWLQAHSRQR